MGRFEAPNGHDFWFVQEICFNPDNPGSWNFMYTLSATPMAATEFQGGRLERELAGLRAEHADEFVIVGAVISVADVSRTVFLVCPIRALRGLVDDFEQWFRDPTEVIHRTKVPTRFGHAFLDRQHLHGVNAVDSGSYNGRAVAWWSLEDKTFWTLHPMIARHICSWLNREVPTEG